MGNIREIVYGRGAANQEPQKWSPLWKLSQVVAFMGINTNGHLYMNYEKWSSSCDLWKTIALMRFTTNYHHQHHGNKHKKIVTFMVIISSDHHHGNYQEWSPHGNYDIITSWESLKMVSIMGSATSDHLYGNYYKWSHFWISSQVEAIRRMIRYGCLHEYEEIWSLFLKESPAWKKRYIY